MLMRWLRRLKFLLTHLMRGATYSIDNSTLWRIISTHAPHARCDLAITTDNWETVNFYSRTSCEVRHDFNLIVSSFRAISTHAPHARCDVIKRLSNALGLRFLLTHLMRGATRGRRNYDGTERFLLTHLMRGATRILKSLNGNYSFLLTHLMRGAT